MNISRISILSLLFLFSQFLYAQKTKKIITLTLNQPPELEIQALDDIVYAGEPVQLGTDDMVSGGSGGYSYQWLLEDGLDNPSSARPWTTPTNDITYTLVITDGNNCSQTITQTVTLNTTNITDLRLQPKINVYPNPADKLIHISIHHIRSIPRIKYALFNISGKQVLTKELHISASEFETTLIVNRFNAGVYMLVVSSDEFVVKKRIVLF